jgi:hypothetical protein
MTSSATQPAAPGGYGAGSERTRCPKPESTCRLIASLVAPGWSYETGRTVERAGQGAPLTPILTMTGRGRQPSPRCTQFRAGTLRFVDAAAG